MPFDNWGTVVSSGGGTLGLASSNTDGTSETGGYSTTTEQSRVLFDGGRRFAAQASLTGPGLIEWRRGEVSETISAGSTLTVQGSGTADQRAHALPT